MSIMRWVARAGTPGKGSVPGYHQQQVMPPQQHRDSQNSHQGNENQQTPCIRRVRQQIPQQHCQWQA